MSIFNGCRYNLCIFARDLSILRVVDIIYAFSRDTYSCYYGDIAIIYAFSHEICLFLIVDDIIYALSRHTYPYYYGDEAIIYAFFARDLSLFNGCRYNLCIFARDLSKLRVVDIIYAFS